jgi:transposase
MGRKSTQFSEEEKAEILAAQKKQRPVHITKRLLALKLKAVDGMRSAEAGKIAGIHTTSVNRIVNRYHKEGIEAIVGVRHHSEHRYMSREEEAAFLAQFQAHSEAGQIIETRDIHQAYEKAVGHRVTRNMIYYLLYRHKWRKVVPRSRHEKKASKEAIEAYKKNHLGPENDQKGTAKASCDVPGRGWVWENQ